MHVQLGSATTAGSGTEQQQQQQQQENAPAPIAAAIKLALELQLLAADQTQHWRQQQQQGSRQGRQAAAGANSASSLLFNSDWLLLVLLRSALEADSRLSSSGLPPELLQQAGLQLLQALAAPLQQLQLGSPEDTLHHFYSQPAVMEKSAGHLYALRGVTTGLVMLDPSLGKCQEWALITCATAWHVQHGQALS
jgi:hypothetical protein